ncbi:MAG TPA: MFS transporter [Polyangiaceae bacterium]|nr:MFS transporter [Polyangiaceae bacterium]
MPPKSPSTRPTLYTRSFALLLGLQVAFSFSFSTFFLLPKFLATSLAAEPIAIGVVTAMFGLSGLAAIPVVGVRIDTRQRRRFLIEGSALMAAAAFGFLWVDHAGALAAVLRLLQGLAWAMVFNASLALTSDVAPAERMAEAIGTLGAASLVMNAVAPAVAEPIAERAGYGVTFALAGAASVVATYLAVRVKEPPVPVRERASSLADFARRPVTVMMALIVGSAGAAFGVMFSFHQPFALEVGIRHVRGFFLAYTAGALAVRLGLGRVADRVGRLPVAVGALALYGVAVAGMRGLTLVKLWTFGGLFGVAHGFFFPAFNAMVLDAVRDDERGKAMTLSNGFFSVGSASVMGLGFAVERVGYPPVFGAAGGCAIVAAGLLFAWRRVVTRV